MKRVILPAILAACLGQAVQRPLLAQPVSATPAPIAPEAFRDEFDGGTLDPSWSWFHRRYGWPDKVKAADVGESTPGALHIAPTHSGWVRDLNAPFLFKTVQGDFDIRARVRMRGRDGPIPGGTWSLGGLMARVPNGLTEKSWEPRRENWHFITTGVGHEPGKPMTETKGTYNSYSSLKLRPIGSGWIELRLVRIGHALFALARSEGETAWQLRDRFYRMEMNPFMQVGLIAYTNSGDVPPGPEDAAKENRTTFPEAGVDALFEVDWVRGRRPRSIGLDYWTLDDEDGAGFTAQWYAQVSGKNPLVEPGLTDAQLLSALGD